MTVPWLGSMSKGKGKGSCFESRLHDNACSTDFTFPLARWVPMQPATIDPNECISNNTRTGFAVNSNFDAGVCTDMSSLYSGDMTVCVYMTLQKKPVTTMLACPWKCTVLHCNHLGNTWKPLVLMT